MLKPLKMPIKLALLLPIAQNPAQPKGYLMNALVCGHDG